MMLAPSGGERTPFAHHCTPFAVCTLCTVHYLYHNTLYIAPFAHLHLHSVITPNCPSVWNTLHCCIIHAENIWPFLRGKEGVRRDKTLPDFWGISKTFSNTFLAKSYISPLLASLYFHSFFPEASPKHVDLGDPGRLKVPAKYPPNSLACSRSNPSLLALSTAHFIVARVKNANQC